MAGALFFLYFIFSLMVLYHGMKPLVWEIGSVFYLFFATFIIGLSWPIGVLLWLAILAIILVLHVEPIQILLTDQIYSRAKKSVPKLSKTEEEALNAGDTWLEKDIFTGTLNWNSVDEVNTTLSAEEQAFLDNETKTLCSLVSEWDISQKNDLSEQTWQYIKNNGFLGLVIKKEYGGKGFSARAHSDIVLKIASHSGATAVTVMVPNSLGPGELLQLYGTEEQKNYYLPRLAKGLDIPCFALTEPDAGSDATSIKSEALVIKKTIDGNKVLGLSITLNKRWITLAPVATLIALAVRLKDPDGLLQGVGSEGITCVLISRETPNLEIGNRHLPANQAFMNGTIRGKDIFIPITQIIGGQEKAGCGWQMLVECLSIGRSISLPALGTASSAISYLTAGAFARVRRQFNIDIAQFEGVEEKLAEIAGLNYLINATRLFTVAAVDQHKKPSVASAITKYFNTELARIAVNNAMDIHAGRAVVNGPRNYLNNLYQSIPISITVEGANIMSRNLLIFGQGSMACHPYVREEFYAISGQNKDAFSRLLWQHIGYFIGNFARTFLTAWTGGWFIIVKSNALKKAHQRLQRLSYAFAWLADFALIYLGGSLKRKERLSARLADGMSYLYMAMAALHYCDQHNNHPDQKVHAQWAADYCFYQAQKAMLSFCRNFPSKLLGMLIRFIAFPWGQSMRLPSDKSEHKLAQLMAQNNDYRNYLIKSLYLSGDPNQAVDKMEYAFQLTITHADLLNKVADLKRYNLGALKDKLAEKVANNVLSQEEMDTLLLIEKARWDAMQVDEFTFDSMKKATFASITDELHTTLDA